jgi:carboxymethylenebutenolidase
MTLAERTERVTSHDGGSFDALVVLPSAGADNGILLLQEIFGVNDYVRAVAYRVAALGHVVLAPDLYWRIEPGIALGHDEQDLQKAFGYVQRFDWEEGLRDCGAALEHLRGLREVGVGERVGVLGFCFGGSLAYQVAAEFSPDFVVSYYGSRVPDELDRADEITCPALLHFGGADPYIPAERIEETRRVLAPRPDTELHVYEGATHAFDNPAPMFHHKEAAAAAWARTETFLRRFL